MQSLASRIGKVHFWRGSLRPSPDLCSAVFAVLTVFFGLPGRQDPARGQLPADDPDYSPYIRNFLKNQEDIKGLGNAVRITVETTQGDILSKEYLETLRKVSEEVFYVPGVDRGRP